VSSFFLKLNSDYFYAVHPQEIYSGNCFGIIEAVNIPEKHDAFLNSELKIVDTSGKKKIFICEFLKMTLMPLIPFAAGFIFKEGSSLHHFANNLRQNKITACIDSSLWYHAKKLTQQQNETACAELNCGKEKQYSKEVCGAYCQNLNYYFKKIEENPIKLSIYDIQTRQFASQDKSISPQFGLKTISVNGLLNNEFMIPETLILSNLDSTLDEDIFNNSIDVIHKKFPFFEKTNDYCLMMRASLYSHSNSKTIKSGLITSSAIHSESEFKMLLKKYITQWKNISTFSNQIKLSIIIQEQIQASVLGVLFTRLPWDFESNKMIYDLTISEPWVESPIHFQVISNDIENTHKDQIKIQISKLLQDELEHLIPKTLNNDKFFSSFSQFLTECFELQNKYRVPLDIEFAVTKDLKFYFTQFRHIFNYL
jgi:hypothetical protein